MTVAILPADDEVAIEVHPLPVHNSVTVSPTASKVIVLIEPIVVVTVIVVAAAAPIQTNVFNCPTRVAFPHVTAIAPELELHNVKAVVSDAV